MLFQVSGKKLGIARPVEASYHRLPPEIVSFDKLVTVAASIAMFAFAWRGNRITRIEGAVLLMGYVAYIFMLLPKT